VPVAGQTDWLDGPLLVAWLEERGLENPSVQLGRDYERAIRHWRDGRRANVYTADPILVKLGLHLSELPPECWVDPPDRGQVPAEKQAEILRLAGEGRTPSSVARLARVDHKTVRRCIARAGLEAAA
jgi:hypothetical protein